MPNPFPSFDWDALTQIAEAPTKSAPATIEGMRRLIVSSEKFSKRLVVLNVILVLLTAAIVALTAVLVYSAR